MKRLVLFVSMLTGPILVSPAHAAPFLTEARPQLVAVAPGVTITPILTAGDVVRTAPGAFQFTGVPDGIGVVQVGPGTLDVLVNHELATRWGDVADSRVDHLTLNASGEVVGARYVLDGSEGYEGLCSGTVATVSRVPWFLTGEERLGTSMGGIAIAVDPLTDRIRELPWFGALNHENVVPVEGLARSVVFLPEDSFSARSQGYAFFAASLRDALRGRGTFTAFVPDDPGDGEPSANDLAVGERMRGRFVPIPDVESYDGRDLDAVTESLTPFGFVRIEDAVPDPTDPGVVYFADTGSAREGSDLLEGRLYRFTFDPQRPRRAVLEVVLAGDAGDPVLNPDNLGISDTTLMIQENHSDPASRAARVWAYDLASGTLTAIARTDPTVGAVTRGGGRGVWESSGIVDVSAFFGEGTWLLDVQAHQTTVPQQGPSLRIDSAEGRGGQLLLMHVPGT